MDGRVGGTGRRFPLASPTTAVALCVLTLLLLVVDVPLEAQIHTLSAFTAVIVVLVVPFAVVGAVVARREPSNSVGWLLIAVAFVLMLAGDASDYTVFVYRAGHHGWPLGALAVLLDLGFVVGLMLIPLIIVLFPDGRLSRRWKWPLGAYLALVAIQIAGLLCVAAVALGHRIPVDGSGRVIGSSHPHGAAAWFGVAKHIIPVAVAVFCLASVARQVVSYRGSSGVRRQQLKWLGSGAATCIAGLLLVASGLGSTAPAVVWIIVFFAWAALPLSIGVGILRYRLYEIDRLISRTVSYAILTALLVGTFIAIVALTTDVLPLSGRVGVAASTLAAAALFNPLRIRIQRLVDRRFNRTRYDAEATVAAFTTRLRDAVELDAVRADLLDAVKRAVQPTHASLWIKP